MELVIPDGAQVHITIGHTPHLLALPDENVVRTLPAPAPSFKGHFVKSALAAVLLFGAFQAGRLTSHATQPVSIAQAASEQTTTPVVPAQAGLGATGEIPSAFRDQLARAPQVSTPPRQLASEAAPTSPSGSPAGNPFGLHE